MLKKFAPSQNKKRKISENPNLEKNQSVLSFFKPTDNQQGCIDTDILDEVMDSEGSPNSPLLEVIDSEEFNQSQEDSDMEDEIEDYIDHLELIRSLSVQEFDSLKEDIRSQSIDFQM